MKRQTREFTNQVLVFDSFKNSFNIIKAKGYNVQPRKDHCAAVIGSSMLVFGGMFQNGSLTNELLVFDLDYYDWVRLPIKQSPEPMAEMKCCAVTST
jgi:N-acetylneuraminic acid mutarotase